MLKKVFIAMRGKLKDVLMTERINAVSKQLEPKLGKVSTKKLA